MRIMKYLFCAFCLAAALLFVPQTLFANNSRFLNRIEGQIFDEDRHPLGDMYVELLNDVGSPISTQRASALGRFSFMGLSTGRFKVRVLSSGKNFLEQTKDVEFIPSVTGRSDDIQYLDFYLRIDKRAANIVNQGPAETIFVQDITADARKLYTSGVERLDRKDDKGLADLENAIGISPYYFDALSRLGKEYAVRKNYEKAYPFLLRAIDINARSYSSYYTLGIAFYQLNQIPAATKAAEACVTLRSDAVDAHLLYGTLLRLGGGYQEAETELKKALSLAKTPVPDIHWQLALLYNKLNRNKEAADQLEAFLKISPDAADKKEIRDLIAKLRIAKQN